MPISSPNGMYDFELLSTIATGQYARVKTRDCCPLHPTPQTPTKPSFRTKGVTLCGSFAPHSLTANLQMSRTQDPFPNRPLGQEDFLISMEAAPMIRRPFCRTVAHRHPPGLPILARRGWCFGESPSRVEVECCSLQAILILPTYEQGTWQSSCVSRCEHRADEARTDPFNCAMMGLPCLSRPFCLNRYVS